MVVARRGVAGHRVEGEAVVRSGDVGGVVLKGVSTAPAGDDLMGLEAVERGVVAGVVGDQPAVALDVDPGVGAGKGCSVEGVADEPARGRAFLDVDALGGRRTDVVVADQVVVAAVRRAVAVLAPARLADPT